MRKYSIGVFFEIWTADLKKWQEQADFINSHPGVEHIEIMLEDVDLKTNEIKFLKDLLSSYKIVVHAPFMGLSLLSPHEEITQASISVYKKAANISKILGAEVLTFHMETYPNYYQETEVQNRAERAMNSLSREAGLKIAVENISYGGKTRLTYPSNPEQVYRLSSFFNSSIGFALDVGHFLVDQFDPTEVFSSLKDKVFNIHLHDGQKGKGHLELGKGTLDLERFLSTLNKANYGGYLSLEVMGQKEITSSWKTLKRTLGE